MLACRVFPGAIASSRTFACWRTRKRPPASIASIVCADKLGLESRSTAWPVEVCSTEYTGNSWGTLCMYRRTSTVALSARTGPIHVYMHSLTPTHANPTPRHVRRRDRNKDVKAPRVLHLARGQCVVDLPPHARVRDHFGRQLVALVPQLLFGFRLATLANHFDDIGVRILRPAQPVKKGVPSRLQPRVSMHGVPNTQAGRALATAHVM